MAHNAGEASKAYRLRKARQRGETLKPIDALWLSDYDHKHGPGGEAKGNGNGDAGSTKSFGASKSGRRVSATFDLEEQAEAIGVGDSPAAIAAAAALQSREEGRRIDSLSTGAVVALKEAVTTYRSICKSLQAMLETYQHHHLETLASVREHYLARTAADSEVARMVKEADGQGDPVNALMMTMLAKHFGVDPAMLPAVADVAGKMGAKPKKNGAAKS